MASQSLLITRAESGQTVAAVLHHRLKVSWSEARKLIASGRVLVGGARCGDDTRRVSAGQRIEVQEGRTPASGGRKPPGKSRQPQVRSTQGAHAPRSPGDAPRSPKPQPVIYFTDPHLVVVDKPAGLTTVRHAREAEEFGRRAQRFLPPTLADLLPRLLAEEEGRTGSLPHVTAVHRLDRDTTGLVIFARTPEAARHLGRQFRAHSSERRYLALVRGKAKPARIESHLIEDRGDGRRGSATQPGIGEHAVTHVAVVEELGDYTLVECVLETGRTHQVRIHLGEAGTPLCGERVYDRPLHGSPLPDGSGAARPMLHAAVLAVDHPVTGERLRWRSPLPAEMEDLMKELRR
jgi:23S rRNA pseudouridine1911/1915/1917 synthase